MSFIKKDVNFGLLFILVLLAVAITLIGIYYNQNYTTLKENYDSKVANFEQVRDELLFHKNVLNKTAQDLQIKEQDETELNKKYTELRSSKEAADKENAQLKTDLASRTTELAQKTNDLFKANQQITIMQANIAQLTREEKTLQDRISSLNRKLDKACGGDVTVCS